MVRGLYTYREESANVYQPDAAPQHAGMAPWADCEEHALVAVHVFRSLRMMHGSPVAAVAKACVPVFVVYEFEEDGSKKRHCVLVVMPVEQARARFGESVIPASRKGFKTDNLSTVIIDATVHLRKQNKSYSHKDKVVYAIVMEPDSPHAPLLPGPLGSSMDNLLQDIVPDVKDPNIVQEPVLRTPAEDSAIRGLWALLPPLPRLEDNAFDGLDTVPTGVEVSVHSHRSSHGISVPFARAYIHCRNKKHSSK